MAPSLQELIDFLLNEVALCGNQGATLSEVLNSIEVFYHSIPKDATQRQQTVDRRFKAKVWSWLTRNPEVSVGKNNEFNHLSLSEVEELDTTWDENHQAEETADAQDESSPAASTSPLRIFVSNQRIWLAIAGHEPDESKVPTTEFVLLSIIASFKSDGIAQTELVKLSGQDKRSVPKRTDALENKGYIEKRAIQVRSSRTSLCTLRRFLQPTTGEPGDQKSQAAAQTRAMIDFDAFTNKLFEILKEFGIISRNDLKKLLGFDDPWRWRILSRALRKFERIGVLKRVRAESQYERLHPCVMLLREPTEKDMEKFHEFTRADMIRPDDESAELDEDIEMDAAGKPKPAGADGGAVVVKKEENVVDAGRTVPSWTPDRNLNNQVFELIDSTGITGITNMDINRICFGSFYRRPSESVLHRLVDCWQLSQPLHLRHLAIVRDTAIERTVFYYVHYSARNFAKLVEAGEASWEAVEFSKKGKAANFQIPAVDAKPQLDQYGFPSGPLPKGLLKNGNASLFEGVAICRPPNYLLSSSDPLAVQLPDGRYAIHSGPIRAARGTPMQSPAYVPRAGRVKGSLNKSILRNVAKSSPGTPDVDDPEVSMAPPDALSFTPSRTARNKQIQLMGLSKKERFEAMGMDETWTEYNVLLIDRPTPGVYVTPHGRRRPVGKKQGRPRQSRIAVFKSAKLASFPWFIKEGGDSDKEETNTPYPDATWPVASEQRTPSHEPAAANPEDLIARTTAEHPQPSFRRPKRTQAVVGDADSPTPSFGPTGPKSYRGRPHKKARLDGGPDLTIFVDTESTLPQDVEPSAKGRGKDAVVHPLGADENQGTTPKRRRIRSPERLDSEAASQRSTPAALGRSMEPPQKPVTPLPRDMSMERTPSVAPGTPKSQKTRHHAAADRGGSIGILRRKIVMDIVEKAGGAYPSGNEIWYPFATAWMKSNHKERPDMRTVKGAVKHLVDAGKLRQLTFSGRDSKGVMITKTILAKPELSPDDPLIKDLQAALLANDRREPKMSYSPHVEADPFVTRNGGQPMVQKFALPVVSGTTVQLQQKPAAVRYEEQRQERKLQRDLLRQLAGESKPARDSRKPGTKRLMTIQRPSAQGPASNAKTSISRPTGRPRGRPRIDRLMKTISTIGSTSMLMSPEQTLHSATGTFATGARIGTFGKPRGVAQQPVGNVAEYVQELAQLARQTQDPSLTSDKILEWELGHEEMFDAILEDHPYIDHAVDEGTFYAAPIAGRIRFDVDQPVIAPPPARSPMTTRRRRPPLLGDTTTGTPSQVTTQQLPQRRRLDTVDISLAARKEVQPDGQRQQPRRHRHVQPLSQPLYRRIMVAIVAVRVLASGIEGRVIDWDLVSAAFPSEDASYIQERAKSILGRNRLQITKMQRDFQERYVEAYAKDQVPRIDYTKLDKYNWLAVVEWANIELDVTTSERAPSLPATREQFDSIFELREEPVPTGDELYGTTSSITVAHKRSLMSRVPFAVLMNREQGKPPGPRKVEIARLEVTKTWVRANIVTPEATYRSEEARQTLNRFGESLVDSAVQTLLTERVIGFGNRGRVVPGRNYDITEHLLQQINRKRTIECTILRRAAHFKTAILDPQLQSAGVSDVQYSAHDGDILALINLTAAGRISLHPRGAPRDKFGLIDGGYLTRQMDKSRVRFSIEIRPCPSYVYGNPVHARTQALSAPPPPPSQDAGLPPKIPLWFDIHGHLVSQIWEMAIASVIGCVAMRQGLSARAICSMIKPAMGAWEIELLLGWLVEVGVVCQKGSGDEAGWKVQEWWWMVLT